MGLPKEDSKNQNVNTRPVPMNGTVLTKQPEYADVEVPSGSAPAQEDPGAFSSTLSITPCFKYPKAANEAWANVLVLLPSTLRFATLDTAPVQKQSLHERIVRVR